MSCRKCPCEQITLVIEIHVAVTPGEEKEQKQIRVVKTMSFCLSHLSMTTWRRKFVAQFRMLQHFLSLKHRRPFGPSFMFLQATNIREDSEVLSFFHILRICHWRLARRKKMGGIRGSPEASSKKKSMTLRYLFDLDSKAKPGNNHSSPNNNGGQSPFDSEKEEILSAISTCHTIFTFTDPSESPELQDVKRLNLLQLLSVAKSPKKQLNDYLLPRLVSMLSANLFRPLDPPPNTTITGELPEDEEMFSSPQPLWPHLQIVYDILLRLVLHLDPKILCNYMDHYFLTNLLSLFRSEDLRERDCLKNVYHRIYAKFTFYRSFMRKAMTDMFLHYVFGNEHHAGIAELLEIWGSIINGFTVPLKEGHKLFLIRVLIPLHKTKGVQAYHGQLAYCVSQFVQKEPSLGGLVVRGILKYWPVTNCLKEVLLIGELEELVDNLDPDQYRRLALPICTKITKCLNSCNSQVAERALYVWNNEQFVKMASSALEDVFQVIVEGMEKNMKSHWSKNVKQLTENVIVMLEKMDPNLYSKCLQAIEIRESAARQQEMKRKEKWDQIESLAAAEKRENQFLQPQKCMCVSH